MKSDFSYLLAELSQPEIKMGEIKKLAKPIKKDQQLALQLWATEQYSCRLLATLLLDKKQLTQELIEQLAGDIDEHPEEQQNQLSDWLLANQLMKDKQLTTMLNGWRTHARALLRRWFWYHQARLRWAGQTPPNNSAELLAHIENDLANEVPQVQWAMNFCAGWMGVYQADLRQRCIDIGQQSGLYKDENVPRNCTPSYLPAFIAMEVAKRT